MTIFLTGVVLLAAVAMAGIFTINVRADRRWSRRVREIRVVTPPHLQDRQIGESDMYGVFTNSRQEMTRR